MMSSFSCRDLRDLFPLRTRHGSGERSAYVRACALLACKPPPKKPSFLNFFLHRQILSHWDRLPLELRQTIQWMADRQQAHDRLKRGWEKIHLQGFKDVCQFCRVRLQPRDDLDKLCIDLPQPHCQQCNICFDCLIYYDNESSLTTKLISATV